MVHANVSTFRRYSPQFIASFARNLLYFSLGLSDSFMAIVIPALTGISAELNPGETLSITAEQASWLASIAYAVQPLGCIVTGTLNDVFGRRRTMMLVNIPFIVAWFMLAYANSIVMVGVGVALNGLGIGLMFAPCLTYCSEICEPSIRGVMLAIGSISTTSGNLMIYLLGSFIPWRKVALICAVVPSMTVIIAYLIPDTPIWLLSKNRDVDAMRSLQWLRGWVKPIAVQHEYRKLCEFSKSTQTCAECQRTAAECTHLKSSYVTKVKSMAQRHIQKPFILCVMMEVFLQFSALAAIRPYVIQIFKAYGIQLDAHLVAVYMSIVSNVSCVCLIVLIKLLGKRLLYLVSTVACTIITYSLGIYAYVLLPSGWTSFGHDSTEFEHIKAAVGPFGLVALILFLVLQFSSRMGLQSLSAMFMGEVFPFRSRSFMCGMIIAVRYIFATTSTKTYFNIEGWLSLPGAMCFYGTVTLSGFVVSYFILPETEKRSLQDIEEHYADNSLGMTDIKIRMQPTASADAGR